MERISIPDLKTRDVARQAADITIQTIREAGLDPMKVGRNPMGVAIVQGWVRGEHTRADVLRMLRNLGILNPALRNA